MASRPAIAMATGSDHVSAARAAPPRMNARMISSVAYADDDDRVRAEDRQRLRLGQAFAGLLLLMERSPEHDRADPGDEARAGRGRDAGRLLGGELALARVAEERRVGPLDADPLVAGFAALQRPPAADHDRSVMRRSPDVPRAAPADRRRGCPPGRSRCRTRRGARSRVRPRGRAPGRPPAGRHRAADRRCPG